MLLLVDVGNTHTVFGLSHVQSDDILLVRRFSSDRGRTADEWHALLQPISLRNATHSASISGMIVASVVPAITRHIVELGRRYVEVEPIVVDATLRFGIQLDVDAPSEVGADRLVNCAYAYAVFGGPTVVIDLGTATKIEVVSEDGRFLGGIIAPGIGLSLETLASRAARLYAVELETPTSAIGRNTIAAVQSGVVLGHIAMIEGMLGRISRELGEPRTVLLTGGFGAVVASSVLGLTKHIPDLTLRGLRLLYTLNQPS